MKNRISFFLLTILILSFGQNLKAQILKDTSAVRRVKSCIDHIYNYEFKEASADCELVHKLYPDHPALYLLKGLITYWQNYPLMPETAASQLYEDEMKKSISLCENYQGTEDLPEYLLTNLCARGMLLLFYADNDMRMEVFPMALTMYRYIRKAFGYTSVHIDFLYFTGIYNYYQKVYPEAYPVYKPLAVLVPKGNKELGLRQLQTAAVGSVVLKAESLTFLSEVYIRFEGDYSTATQFNKTLSEMYPGNMEYKEDYIKNLLLIKKYSEAEDLIRSCGNKTISPFYNAQLLILNGILQEKRYHNYDLASSLYLKGISEISSYGKYGNEFTAYAYYGLSRLSEIKGNKENRKKYRKLANDLVTLKKVNFD